MSLSTRPSWNEYSPIDLCTSACKLGEDRDIPFLGAGGAVPLFGMKSRLA